MISGIDLSDKNGSADWSLFGNGDVNFVYIKASEAIDSVDSMYEANMKKAKELGILAGAYHWLYPQLHVGQQAEIFLNTVKNFKGMLPPAICLEAQKASQTEMERNVRVFVELMRDALGAAPVIYTSESYWKGNLAKADWACEYPLWLDKPGSIWPSPLFPWAGWSFWQYSYQARLPGVATNLGLNWFNGSITELKKMVIR
jgi:lysozyme